MRQAAGRFPEPCEVRQLGRCSHKGLAGKTRLLPCFLFWKPFWGRSVGLRDECLATVHGVSFQLSRPWPGLPVCRGALLVELHWWAVCVLSSRGQENDAGLDEAKSGAQSRA